MARQTTSLRAVEAPARNAIPEIVVKHLVVTVQGIKPLLTHNPASMQVTPSSTKGSRIPTREAEAEAGTYRTADGAGFAITGDAFRKCLLDASTAWKSGRGSMLRNVAHIVVVEELVTLLSHSGDPLRHYDIDARTVVVQRSRVLRARPRFDEWQCQFTIEYDPQLIADSEALIRILSDGGNRLGVGDYRPATRGYYGRFRVIDWRVVD